MHATGKPVFALGQSLARQKCRERDQCGCAAVAKTRNCKGRSVKLNESAAQEQGHSLKFTVPWLPSAQNRCYFSRAFLPTRSV